MPVRGQVVERREIVRNCRCSGIDIHAELNALRRRIFLEEVHSSREVSPVHSVRRASREPVRVVGAGTQELSNLHDEPVPKQYRRFRTFEGVLEVIHHGARANSRVRLGAVGRIDLVDLKLIEVARIPGEGQEPDVGGASVGAREGIEQALLNAPKSSPKVAASRMSALVVHQLGVFGVICASK